jgi:hypothetical protein
MRRKIWNIQTFSRMTNYVQKFKNIFSQNYLLILYYWGLHLLGRHSTPWAMPPALFALSSFSDRVLCFFALASLDCNCPTYDSSVIEITGMHHHTWHVLLKIVLFILFITNFNPCPYPQEVTPKLGWTPRYIYCSTSLKMVNSRYTGITSYYRIKVV